MFMGGILSLLSRFYGSGSPFDISFGFLFAYKRRMSKGVRHTQNIGKVLTNKESARQFRGFCAY